MIVAALVAFAAGVTAAQGAPALPPPAAAYLLCVPAIGVVAAVFASPAGALERIRFARSVIVASMLALGLGYAFIRAEARLADALAPEWEGVILEVVGVIDDLPARDTDRIRFAFRIEHVRQPAATVPARVALAWHRPRSGELAGEALPDLRAGERWRWQVRLARPHGYVNGVGFDREAWMLENGLRASGSVLIDQPMQRLAVQSGGLRNRTNALRQSIRDRIDATLAADPARGVLAALTIGDQRALAPQEWALYHRANISHLLSISGAHVTLFAAWVAALVLFLWRRSPALSGRLPAQKAAALVALVVAIGYALLAGFEIPAQRTCLMLAVAALTLWLDRALSPWLILAWSLAAVLVWDPWAPLAIGFWFSFTAVALLIYIGFGRVGARPIWPTLLAAQAIMAVGLAPLTLALFQQVSLIGPLANAVAIPLVTLVIVPVALIWLVLPWPPLLHLAAWLVSWLTALAEWLTALPFALWFQHAPPMWAVVAALAGSCVLFMPAGLPHRWAGVLLWLPVFTVGPERVPPGEFRLTALDVGQGTGIVIETARSVLLYDTGPRWDASSDAGNRLIVPWLRAMGHKRIDTLLLSHGDIDHIGGAVSVIADMRPHRLLANLATDDAVAAAARLHAVPVEPCLAGQRWVDDGVRFEVLAPRALGEAVSDNDASCVLAIESATGFRALLPGDAETRAEQTMLAGVAGRLRAEVLVAGHHGARNASGEAFLAAVAPRHVLITVGRRNRYGHPHPETLARLAALGAAVHRTDCAGAIRIDSREGKDAVARHARESPSRYWRSGCGEQK